MAQEMDDKDKEKENICIAQICRDHHVWSSGDEDEEPDKKRNRGKICMVASSD